jgi:serine/threonine-protein kinase
MDTDRNLLFGVLALQADLIDNDRFARGCALWAADKGRPLAQVLVEQGWLSPDDRADVDKLLSRKLAKHGGDAKAGLAEVTTDQVRQSLAGVNDADVHRSLAGPTPPPQGRVLLATTAYVPEARDRYTLSRLHATGGIGRVWLARDASLGRDVALKELRPERAGHPAQWGRFLREAQVTGQLEHPGIVPVYEVGRRPDDQAPFYTMRFVRGRRLAEAARAYHERCGRGEAGPLEVRELLTAFVGVCHAVAYAHSRGVLHRDLKPQNVVLGDFGEVIVLDWGLAKVMGEAGGDATVDSAPVALAGEGSRDETVAGQVLGTPAYMAPEQAEGRQDLLDARTDVYGLGAVLYEVLAGRPPFGGGDTTTVLRRVAHEAPQPPRVVAPGVPRALEAVCLKALAKRPERRYASAKELAEDVKRFLADEPVTAYRDPLMTRLTRWGRRHRTPAAVVAVALLTALGGLGAVLAVQARANRDLASKNAELAEANERERQRFDLALEAVQAFHTGVSEDVLLKQKDFEPLRKKLLDSAAEFYRKLQAQLGDAADARDQAALAKAYAGLAGVASAVGSTEQALKDYGRAQELYEARAAADPGDPSPRRELVGVLIETAYVCESRKDTDGQRRAAARAVAVAEELAAAPAEPQDVALLVRALTTLGNVRPDSPDERERHYRRAADLGERLAADHADVAEYQSRFAAALNGLANVAYARGRYEDSARLNTRAAQAWEAALRVDASDAKNRRGLAATYGNAGLALSRLGRVEGALGEFRHALQVLEQLAAEQSAVIDYQTRIDGTHQNIGWALANLGRDEEAAESCRRQVAVLETLVARHPDRPDLRDSLAHALMNTGLMLAKTGHQDEALSSYRRAIGVLQALVKAYPQEPGYRHTLGHVLRSQGYLLSSMGKSEQATAAYEQARDAFAAVVEARPAEAQARGDLADSWRVLGFHLGRSGRVAEGLAALGRARELAERLAAEQPGLPGPRVTIYGAVSDTGFVLLDSGDAAAAAAAFQRGLALAEQLAKDYPKVVDYRANVGRMLGAIGLAHQRAGQLAEARAALERCRGVWEQVAAETPAMPENRDELGRALANLGYLESLAGDPAAALPLHQKAVAIREQVVAEAPKNTEFQRGLAYSLTYLGQTYRRLGKRVEADPPLKRALALVEPLLKLRTQVSMVQELHLETRLELGLLRLSEEKPAEAADHFAQAIRAAAGRSDRSVDELARLAAVHAQMSKLPDGAAAAALVDVPDTPRSAKAHADRAMALLSRAAAQGFGDVLLLTRSDAYDPLRDRDDFRALLKRLQDKAKPAGK